MLLPALLIFALRLVELSLDTLRTLVVLRGNRPVAWVLGFFQAGIFVIVISFVLANLDNVFSILGYAAGFATGNVAGMWIEEKLAIGHTHLRIVSSRRGSAVARKLRAEGFAVTEIPGRGKDGTVTLLNVSVRRKHIRRVSEIAREEDAEVFITAEDLRPLQRGFWRA